MLTITNSNPDEVPGFQVTIDGLPTDVTVANAQGTSGGLPIIVSAAPLASGASTQLLVEFDRPSGDPNFTPVYTIELLSAAAANAIVNPPAPGGTQVNYTRFEKRPDGSFLIEWSSTPGDVFVVRYSEDLTNFMTIVPSITAVANVTEFIDKGPPQTLTPPGTIRYYQIFKAP